MLRNLALVLFFAASLFVVLPAMAGEGVLRVICTVDGAEYAKGEIRVDGKVRGDCPRADIFLPAGEHVITVEHVIGDGSVYRGNATVTLRDDAAKRQEVSLTKVFTEDYYYGKKDWIGLLKAYPDGRYAAEANQKIEDDLYTRKDWGGLLKTYPRGRYADEAAFRTLLSREYLEKYPGGRFASEARKEIERWATLSADAGKVFRDCSGCPEMVIIPPGSFLMGSPSSEKGRYDSEGPQHRVAIGYSFALSKTEVTQAEWLALKNYNPSSREGDNRPVTNVSWDDVQEFIERLNAKTGKRYRLPTEAEWEYAARAGTTTRYFWGDEIGHNNANCNGCGSQWDKQTASVGSFRPNGFGLYDMHGNVYEWVQDCGHTNYNGAPSDGREWLGSGPCKRVYRGGSNADDPRALRSADRSWENSGARFSNLGFRLARTLP